MARQDEATRLVRVLLVTDDDGFSSMLKRGLPDVELLSVTQDSVWLAIRAGLDLTRGVSALVVDGSVSKLQQLRLYERLRPSDAVSQVPIIFTRATFTGFRGPGHEVDFYQPPDSTPEDAIRLVAHVLGIALGPPRLATRWASPRSHAVTTRRAWTAARGAALPAGLLQRLGLWGVAAALIGFTFWPIIGSMPLRHVMHGPMSALSSAQVSAVHQP